MATEDPPGRSLIGYLGIVTPLLAIAGLALYSYLSYTYERFYHALGVEPSDVGLTYATTLTNSIGFAIDSLADFIGHLIDFAQIIVVILALLAGVGKLLKTPELYPNRVWKQILTARHWLVPLLLLLAALSTVMGFANSFPSLAARSATQVQCGSGINGLGDEYSYTLFFHELDSWHEFVLFRTTFTTLDIKAVPVRIFSTSENHKAPNIEALKTQSLLYLGQSSGMSVFYDHNDARPIYVPTSSILMYQESSLDAFIKPSCRVP